MELKAMQKEINWCQSRIRRSAGVDGHRVTGYGGTRNEMSKSTTRRICTALECCVRLVITQSPWTLSALVIPAAVDLFDYLVED